ncbi:MlaE family lipid ABC transporter permease subunit [soil metagenome]
MPEAVKNVLEIEDGASGKHLKFTGRLDVESVPAIWDKAIKAADKAKVDASGLEYCDGAGMALLWEVQKRGGGRIEGLKPEMNKLLESFSEGGSKEDESQQKGVSGIETLGQTGWGLAHDLYEQVAFLGELAVTFLSFIKHPRALRWNDVWNTYDRAGVQALVVVGMISFLTGLIMAFQAAPVLQQYGVDLFVINLVTLAVVRELGPIMTAIVLAGRSGSAFAAEIGTMKVNEEINALNTMGLNPMRFLVAPRVLASILATPFLTIYSDLLGTFGGIFVMLCRGFPPVALWRQLIGAVTIDDVMAGLIKSFVFGALVAAIGCLRGLQTQSGASAVGVSTTRSVVSGIFLIVVVDAIFAVVYYAIGF